MRRRISKINPFFPFFDRREQTERENIARRRYQQKWGKLAEKDMNRFYNQNYINEMMDKFENSENKRTPNENPSSYTGSGESFFITKDMYESLVATCRCGRPKTGGHVVKCLQKGQYRNHLELGLDTTDNSSSSDKDHRSSTINKVEFAESKQHQKTDKGKSSIISDSFDIFKQQSFPQTSSGLYILFASGFHIDRLDTIKNRLLLFLLHS